ncbi:hypothetical protein [Alteromonas lipolytica]|uniref:Uncharacterized protein n=1 Tax=Alteromonas lipolytica TaxID=1856405 RepID=A0A1E8FAZ2_9ALTE|nr:hypothetical protein [Alteromonas lipolytica]OFI32946.1 hypothetical protein BFC17_01325 [Alteromonas lipolytica]GGF63996.1 hypothetical protein GCM10011338_15430 [Alteromonas lipolytica]
MTVFRFRQLVTASLLLSAVASFNANAQFGGLFSDDDKKAAPWAKEAFLTKDNCADLSYMDMADFLVKYLPLSGDGKNIKKASDQVMTSYILAALAVNQANICLAESLDLKSAKEELLKEREILTSGTSLSEKEIEKHREYADGASAEIRAKTLQTKLIEPAQQKSFVLGASTYLLGTYKTYVIKEDADNLMEVAEKDAQKEKKKSSGGFSMGGLVDSVSKGGDYAAATGTLQDVLEGLPEHLPKLVATAKYFIEYAQSQDLKLEPDATEEFNEAISWD